MKKFTDTQKKWALTATMIAALGCSVSFNPHINGYAALDMSSNADERLDQKTIDLPTSKGMLDVKLTAVKGNQLKAELSPKKDSEGKVLFECKACETTVFVDKKITDNASDIQVAVMAELVKPAKEEKKEVVKEASDTREERTTSVRKERAHKDEDLRSEVDDEYSDLASYIDDGCLGKARNDDRRERRNSKSPTCVADKFLAYIQKYEISDSVTAKYYKTNIEPKILSRIKDGVRLGTDESSDASDEAFETIRTLLHELPEGTTTLRKTIVLTSTKAVAKSAANARDLVAQASSSRSTADLAAAIEQINSTGYLANSLQVMNQDALFDLNGDNNITMGEAKSIYTSAYGRIVQDIKSGMPRWIPVQAMKNPAAINVNAYQIPTISTDFRSGFASDLPPGVLVAPGYENSNQGDWSNRGVNQGNNRGVLIAPQMLQQNSQNGVQMLQPRALTDGARQEADRRQLLQGRGY